MDKRHNIPMGYTRDAVIAWLTAMSDSGKLPDINWEATLGASLPPIIWRKDWNKLKVQHGLPWSRGHIANLDAAGTGPAAYMDPRI